MPNITGSKNQRKGHPAPLFVVTLAAAVAVLPGGDLAKATTRSTGSTPAAISVAAGAKGVWVSPRGDDSRCRRNDSLRPCLSWDRAYRVAATGDKIYLRAGRYGSQTLYRDSSKGAKPVTFAATSRDVVVAGTLQLGADTGSEGGTAPSNIVLQGFEIQGHLIQWQTGLAGQARNLVFRDLRIRWTSQNGAAALTLMGTRGALITNVEIGPLCCNSSAIVLSKQPETPNPSDITIDRVYVHDIANSCSFYPGENCGTFAPANFDRFHVDCLQAYGGHAIQVRNSRFFNCATQGIFAGAANGGTFANWKLENNMIGAISNDTFTPNSNHAVIIGSPGPPVSSGSWQFVHNTLGGNGAFIFDPVQSLDPAASISFVGNVGYLDAPCTGPRGRWRYERNLFGNRRCSTSDIIGVGSFVRDSVVFPDLHLQRGSKGIGRASRASLPRRDIDGKFRPRHGRADIGASQRESGEIVPGQSIGEVYLGARAEAVEAFYGRGARRIAKGVTTVTYGARGHRLGVIYRNSRVIQITTASSFYSTATGLGPGVNVKWLRRLRWNECAKAFERETRAARTYFSPGRASVQNVTVVQSRYDSC